MPVLSDSRPQLAKEIGTRQFFTLAFGTIIGVGWAVVLGEWLSQAGPVGAILGFAAGALLMALIGVCYAEMATIFPVSGGEVAYTYESFGLKTAYLTGWLLALAYVSVTVFEAISIGWVVGTLVPAIEGDVLYTLGGSEVRLGSLLLGLAGTFILMILNYRGLRFAATFQDVLTFGILALFLVFVVAGTTFGSSENLSPLFKTSESGSIWTGVFAVFITAPFWLAGFDVIPQVMEEKAPATSLRLVGRMIVLAIILAGLFYCLVILSASMSTPWRGIVDLELAAAGAFEAAFQSTILAKVVLLAALLGLITSWNAVFIASSRILFALGRARIIPGFFGTVHTDHRTPAKSILIVAVICGLGVFFGRSAILPIVNIAATCFTTAYLLICLGVIKLRRTHPHLHRPYRVPGGRWTAGLAAIGALFVLILSLYQPYVATQKERLPAEWLFFVSWLLLGLLFWVAAARFRNSVGETERRRLILGEKWSEI